MVCSIASGVERGTHNRGLAEQGMVAEEWADRIVRWCDAPVGARAADVQLQTALKTAHADRQDAAGQRKWDARDAMAGCQAAA